MGIFTEQGASRSMHGQLLRQSERREVAIFLRDDALWVADFIDGHGQLIEATTWVRFNCGAHATPQARRRMVLESAVPLSAELVDRIGRLRAPTAMKNSVGLGRLIGAVSAHLPRNWLATLVARRFGRDRTRQVESKT